MRKYISLILIITLLFLFGCKQAVVQPVDTPVTEQEPEAEDNEEPEINNTSLNETEANDTISTEPGTINETNHTELLSPEINNSEENESSSETLPEGTYVIEMYALTKDMIFYPEILNISVGDTVRWINSLDYLNRTAEVSVFARHNQLFRSPMLDYDEYFEYTFTEKGTYLYSAVPYTSWFRNGEVNVG